MEKENETKTKFILQVMHVVAWVAFIGFLIKAGAILFAYGISYNNPNAAKDLYRGLDLYSVRQFDFWHYSQTVSFIVALLVMKAFVAHLVIKILSKIKLVHPFKIEVAQVIEKISYILLGTWIVAVLYNAHIGWLAKRTGILQEEWATDEFIVMAGLVFVISQIFKRGVEIQSENELTV
ncbi:DUF2975 domain-containing protein [uncultured Pontibacter sp.]|uniref:DUF2975 domain-containing protein n=1 Tax=uncultured Pontibacter sp. TaxID=453356 RepID=UPI00262BF4BD|nr:DUF2975 domain-containing protein [uncultured Pontibacter sp.]